MIIVLDPEYVEKNEVLATISDIRAYGFRFFILSNSSESYVLYPLCNVSSAAGT